MRRSRLPAFTLKEVPADAETVSHRLMLRAGLIRQLAAGIYTWLPPGYRVVRKVEQIVREEMDRAGAIELLMPSIQPAELWNESGRWEEYGPELLRINDRHDRDFCYGPTHEEVITDIVRRGIRSYKQLPVNFYQIQTKFRDEIRPRFGVIRAREFIMKDAYSFHMDEASLAEAYDAMYDTYNRIFSRLGLEFRAVRADSGVIGGDFSHEFHVLASSGEDAIVFSDGGDYAANIELAEAVAPERKQAEPRENKHVVDTPSVKSIDELAAFLDVSPESCVKTLIVEGENNDLVALVLRGDHQLNAMKAAGLDGVASPLRMASAARIRELTGSDPGFVGPVGLDCRLYGDHSVAVLSDFVCGANENDQHLTGVNWGRDTKEPEAVDLRNVVKGDPSPEDNGTLSIARGIEVGHIFKLGTKYSEAMGATVLDEQGKSRPMLMGCYGIGVTRIVAAAIEQNHDDAGIIWPDAMAPYDVALIPIHMHKSLRLREAAEALYEEMMEARIAVLFDDRQARPGVMFADSDLVGLPHRVVLSERGLDAGKVEYKGRRDVGSVDIESDKIMTTLVEKLANR